MKFIYLLEIEGSSFLHVCTGKRRHFALSPLKGNIYMKAVKGCNSLGTVQIIKSSLLKVLQI